VTLFLATETEEDNRKREREEDFDNSRLNSIFSEQDLRQPITKKQKMSKEEIENKSKMNNDETNENTEIENNHHNNHSNTKNGFDLMDLDTNISKGIIEKFDKKELVRLMLQTIKDLGFKYDHHFSLISFNCFFLFGNIFKK
jgi:hypothetical protein